MWLLAITAPPDVGTCSPPVTRNRRSRTRNISLAAATTGAPRNTGLPGVDLGAPVFPCPASRRSIAVAGNIGSGKSSLVQFLTSTYHVAPFYEPNDENPYLADFYADMERYGGWYRPKAFGLKAWQRCTQPLPWLIALVMAQNLLGVAIFPLMPVYAEDVLGVGEVGREAGAVQGAHQRQAAALHARGFS